MESNQVVMAARLQSLETSEELSVVTTHLKVTSIIDNSHWLRTEAQGVCGSES